MPEINGGDTAWVLTSTALVMLMTPGLGFFYGGLVRRKNVLSTIMHSFFILGLISVQWVLWGYTLAFGPDIGSASSAASTGSALNGVDRRRTRTYATTIPHLAFMAFQMMFAIITPALITGAFAERKRFKAFVALRLALGDASSTTRSRTGSGRPMAGCSALGALDFAGGTVVHISSGIAALVAALVHRTPHRPRSSRPSSRTT